MLTYIAEHPELLGSEHAYTVIHSVDPVPRSAHSALGSDVVAQYYESEIGAVLNPIREFFQQRAMAPEFVHTIASPAESIAEHARAGGFDLIVMGSHGHGRLASLVLGSVTMKVLAQSTLPVLIIR
jgi:nucleotide-binding universal stress UspA family protein